MAISTIENPNRRFETVSNIDFNSLTKSGLYHVLTPTANKPAANYSYYMVEVSASNDGTLVKQIAKLAGQYGIEYERHYTGGSWKAWRETGLTTSYIDVLDDYQWYRKPGTANYGSFILMGTAGGIGGIAILVIINNGGIESKINLVTGTAWTDTKLTIAYGVEDDVGYIGLKTSTIGSTSRIAIIGG